MAQISSKGETGSFPVPPVICSIYHVLDLIKEGATGSLYRGRVERKYWLNFPLQDNKVEEDPDWVELVLKLEEVGAPKQQMINEWNVYDAISKLNKDVLPLSQRTVGGFLEVKFQQHRIETLDPGKVLNVLATKAQGKDLGEILSDSRNGKLSLKTVLSLGEQMIELLSVLHLEAGYVHRDIKPENFVVGLEKESHLLYLIDFGVAKKVPINDSTNSLDDVSSERKRLIGSVRYLSVHAHTGAATDEVDDLISVAYVLLHLFRGCLPWQGLTPPKPPTSSNKIESKMDAYEAKFAHIASVKSDPKVLTLLEKECPAVCEYLTEVIKLQEMKKSTPSTRIDYDKLKSIFVEWRKKRGLVEDGAFEWNKQVPSGFLNVASSVVVPLKKAGMISEEQGGESKGMYDDLPAEKAKTGQLGTHVHDPGNHSQDGSRKESPPVHIPSILSTAKTTLLSTNQPDTCDIKSLPPFAPPSPNTLPLRSSMKQSGRIRQTNDESDMSPSKTELRGSKRAISWSSNGDDLVVVTEYVLKNLGPPSSVWSDEKGDGAPSPASQEVIELNEEALLSKWSQKLKEPQNKRMKTGGVSDISSPTAKSVLVNISSRDRTSNEEDSCAMVVKALTKILPHLKSDKKCLKALQLFSKLIRLHATPATVGMIVDALACAVSNARKVHQPSLRDAYIELFQTVSSCLLPLCDVTLRHQVALWCIAADVFNTTSPLQIETSTTSSQGIILNESEVKANQLKDVEWKKAYLLSIRQLDMLLEHMLDAFSGGASATHVVHKNEKEGEVADALKVVPVTLFKARLFDVLISRYADQFKQLWMDDFSKAMILSCYEKVLRIPLSWWPAPHGRTHRTTIERTFSTLQARR